MPAIKHLFHIDAPRQKVDEALTTISRLAGWWTTKTTGDASRGGTIQFPFGEFGNDMKVTEMKKNEWVQWECVAGPDEWNQT